ncbi:hypothetical protein D3C85_424820 [compost metagenome]
MVIFIYSIIFITLNYFTLKASQSIRFKWIIFLFLVIAIIGKTYDIIYIKDIMIHKKTFIIMLLFSWAIMPLSFINKYNNVRLRERLNEKEISDFFSKPEVPIYHIALTILITVFQLIIIWNGVRFPNN